MKGSVKMPNILLVEDDEQLARTLIRFLTSEGYQVTHAAGQTDGLARFAERPLTVPCLMSLCRTETGFPSARRSRRSRIHR